MTDTRCDIQTGEIMFGTGEQFDVTAVGAVQTPWWNRTLCSVNDAWVRPQLDIELGAPMPGIADVRHISDLSRYAH